MLQQLEQGVAGIAEKFLGQQGQSEDGESSGTPQVTDVLKSLLGGGGE